MKPNRINRHSHAGKTPFEKDAYREFLAARFHLDKTESDPVNTSKTDASSFEEDKTEPVKPSRKSLRLKVIDFINNNWVVTIIGGIIVALIMYLFIGFVNISINQGIQSKQIDDILGKQKEIISIREMFIAFKSEVSKDIEYIKKRLKM